MNKTAMENKKLQLEEKKLGYSAYRDKKDRRANLVGQLAKGVGVALLTKGIQDASWYKNIIGGTTKPALVPQFFVAGSTKSWPHHVGELTHEWRVAVVNYYNTIGNQDSSLSGTYPSSNDIHLAMTYLYGQTLQNNSRVPTEEAPEYAMYLLCWTDVYAMLHRARLALEICNKYNSENLALGEVLTRALGFQHTDLIKNRADYIGELNALINKANTNTALPADFGYLKRKLYLADTILADANDLSFAQLTVFRQAAYWKYDVLNNKATSYIFGETGSTPKTMSQFLNQIKFSIVALSEAEVCNNIKANFLSAIDMSKFYQMKPYEGSFNCIFYNDEPRYQLLNCNTLPDTFVVETESIDLFVSESGYLFQGSELSPRIKVHSNIIQAPDTQGVQTQQIMNDMQCVLNSFKGELTSDEILVNSRFKHLLEYVGPTAGDGYARFAIASCGAEIVTKISMVTHTKVVGDTSESIDYEDARTLYFYPDESFFADQGGVASALDFAANCVDGLQMTQFDWMPFISLFYKAISWSGSKPKFNPTALTTSKPYYNIYGDIGKIVKLSEENIKTLNSQCNQSLFVLPTSTFKQGF